MHKHKRYSFKTLIEILIVSTRLGVTSFGGPIAHLGYFYEEYIRKRKWLDEKSYADLVALCQFLPGPASSQVGIGIGVMRGGLLGGIVSFLGFIALCIGTYHICTYVKKYRYRASRLDSWFENRSGCSCCTCYNRNGSKITDT